jgi:hypothetical protein
MTKLLDVRVRVPVDDSVSVSDLTGHLQRHLEELPVARLGSEDGPRVHWSAVDVLRAAERTEPKPIERPARGRKAAIETA